MRIFVTGGTGFVLSNVVKHVLQTRPEARVVVLDSAPVSDLVASYFEPFAERLQLVQGDIRDEMLLRSLSGSTGFTHVIHGATVTHDSEMERREPTRYVGVNVNGTVSILEWLRSLPELRRCIHVSTGGVYGDPTPFTPIDLQPETGPFDPPELYAVTKYAAELISRRYGMLFGLPLCRIRLSGVFGPMERPTGARAQSCMSLPYRMTRAAIDRRALRISKDTLSAGGDFLSAEDIADAVAKLLFSRTPPPYDVFNIAAGIRYPISELFETFRTLVPEFNYEIVDPEQAEVRFHPEKHLARHNAYSISRISELGWSPRPLALQLKSYVEWVFGDPQARCPRLNETGA